MATLESLRNVVSRKSGLRASGDELDLIDEWINQGIVEVLTRTQVNVECADIDTIANTWKYILPTGMLAIKEIWREDSSGATDPVIRVDPKEILDLRKTIASGDATLTRYAILGSNLLIIWPTPTSSYQLNIFYVPRPTDLVNPADDPSTENLGRIPKEFHKAIEYYALWQAADYDDDKSSQFGEQYRALFEDYIRKYMLPAINRKGGTTHAQVRTNLYRGPVRRDNSVYP